MIEGERMCPDTAFAKIQNLKREFIALEEATSKARLELEHIVLYFDQVRNNDCCDSTLDRSSNLPDLISSSQSAAHKDNHNCNGSAAYFDFQTELYDQPAQSAFDNISPDHQGELIDADYGSSNVIVLASAFKNIANNKTDTSAPSDAATLGSPADVDDGINGDDSSQSDYDDGFDLTEIPALPTLGDPILLEDGFVLSSSRKDQPAMIARDKDGSSAKITDAEETPDKLETGNIDPNLINPLDQSDDDSLELNAPTSETTPEVCAGAVAETAKSDELLIEDYEVALFCSDDGISLHAGSTEDSQSTKCASAEITNTTVLSDDDADDAIDENPTEDGAVTNDEAIEFSPATHQPIDMCEEIIPNQSADNALTVEAISLSDELAGDAAVTAEELHEETIAPIEETQEATVEIAKLSVSEAATAKTGDIEIDGVDSNKATELAQPTGEDTHTAILPPVDKVPKATNLTPAVPAKKRRGGKVAALIGIGAAAAGVAVALQVPGLEDWRNLPQFDEILHRLSELKRFIA